MRRPCPKARAVLLACAVWLGVLPDLATADLNVEASGVLSDIRVGKTGLVGGASADLEFDLEYLVRVSSLMGAPIVNCGLRVRNLKGSAQMTIMNRNRRVPITAENEAGVSILHLGFVIQQNYFALDGWIYTLTFRCQPGVIAREDTQPFNVASNPGIENFFCANASLPPNDVRNELPDMLGPDWCADLGGSPVPAETARAIIRDGALDTLGTAFGFQPRVVALGIGIGELVAAEREIVAALDEQEQDGKPDPAKSAIERLVAERAQDAKPGEATAPVEPTPSAQTTLARLAADRLRRSEQAPEDPAPDGRTETAQPADAVAEIAAPSPRVVEKQTPLFRVDYTGRDPAIVEIATGTRVQRLRHDQTLVDGIYLVEVGKTHRVKGDCVSGTFAIPALDPRTLEKVKQFEFPCKDGFGILWTEFESRDDPARQPPLEFMLRIYDGARRALDPGPEPRRCTGQKFMKTAEVDGRGYRLDASLRVIENLGAMTYSEGYYAGDALCLRAVP